MPYVEGEDRNQIKKK